MTSGRDALRQIDQSIATAREELHRASNAAASDARGLADLDRRELEIFQGLAELRLARVREEGPGGGALAEAERKAAALVAAHEVEVEKLAAERDAAARRLETLETERREADAAIAAAIALHETAAAETRQRLESNPQWLDGAQKLESLGAMAAKAEQKLAIARDDRANKGAAYEADPLFAYLTARKFGTKDYSAFPLYAALDRWVAGIIRYRDHRLNYVRLLEIPERFADHAARLRAAEAEARSALEAMERTALERDGVGARRAAVEAARAKIETIDTAIASAETAHGELSARHAATAAGKAGPLGEARDVIARELARFSIPNLKVLAAETAAGDDDRLVESLVRNRLERIEFDETRRAAVASLGALGRRLSELEDVRRRFKSARFDSPYSEFIGRDILLVLAAEFLRGAMSRDELWRRIERGHKTRRRDWDNDLGGDEWRGRFGLPDNWGGQNGDWGGDEWRGRAPMPPRPPRMPRAPRPPSGGRNSRGGGFKTGGGF